MIVKNANLKTCVLWLFLAVMPMSCYKAKNTRNLNVSQQKGAAVSEGYQTTESGLQYLIVRDSEGRKPAASDSVTVHYRGTLEDGTEFDSSYSRNEPTSFPLNRVIPGWTEGLQLIGVGGEIELLIPPDLGYGASGTPGGPIPPNATLKFQVELIEIQ